MKRRRFTRALPVAGGVLGAAFLPAAFAFAAGGYSFSPVGHPEVVGFFGMNPMSPELVLTPPAISGSYQSYGEFDVHDGTANLGNVQADVSALSLAPGDYWDTHTYLVTDGLTTGIAAGSLFEIDKFDFLGLTFTTTYSDVINASGHHTYTLTTPFGTSSHAPLDLSKFPPFQTGTPGQTILDNNTAQYLTPAELQSHLLNAGAITGGPAGADYSHFYSFDPASPIQVEAITGALPTVFALQGFQTFNVTDASEAPVGSLTAAVTDTADFGSNSSQAVLVTDPGTSGLPVGSLFMDFYIFGKNLVNHYSSIPGADGHNVIQDYISTGNGNFNFPLFDIDLTKNVFDPFSFNAHGFDISSAGDQSIVATNGLPPFDIAIQGYQDFDWTGPGDATGTFTAAQTTTSDLIGDVFRSVLVTSSTGADAPDAGSVFVDWNFLGLGDLFGVTYADIVTDAGTHSVWDTFHILGLDIAIPVLPLFAIPEDMLNFLNPADLAPV